MTILTILCAAGLLTGLPAAPPSFAGQWVLDFAASDLGGVESGWFGNTVTVTQDDKTITFASGGSGPGTGTAWYRLDGTPTTRTAPSGGPGAGTVRETLAQWEGDRLVLTSRSTSLPDPVTKKSRVSERTVTLHIARDGAFVVDVAVSPESVGRMAWHSVYRRQPSGKTPPHTPAGEMKER